MNIKEILKFIDLSEAESNTFSALLSYPEGVSVLTLSRKLNLPRPTIYGHIDVLINKGLVKKGVGEEGSVFYPETHENILRIYDEKVEKVEQAKEELTKTLSEYKTEIVHKPRFIVYEGSEAYEAVFRDILRSREEQTYWFWPLSEMVKKIPEETFFNFHKERVKRGIWLNVLWPHAKKLDLEKHPLLFSKEEKVSLRRIRTLPKKIEQTVGYGIYGTKVAFISSQRENYAFVIDSKELSDSLKSQFDFLWSLSEKYSK